MGFDLKRFSENIDEEFICSICRGVLQNPFQITSCEHIFCQICINEWISRVKTCPIDRTPIETNQLKTAPRILKNLLHRLNIMCENQGCTAIVKLETLENHSNLCQFAPKKFILCQNGCGKTFSSDEINHNCVETLRFQLDFIQNQFQIYKNDLKFYKTEIETIREFIQTIRINDPKFSDCFQQVENNEILRWSNNLQITRITHWGGMISTPDIVLQETIRDALIESGCSIDLTNQLMEKAHERQWPKGLSTLEIRQLNRRHYESYVCRRILDKQAVVILSCDNCHMDKSMIVEPGLVMIFSHGVK